MDREQARAAATLALAREAEVADSVRSTMDWLARTYPGRSVEVRVPPYRVVQAIEGATHRRGTPPAVVEMDAGTWLRLVAGVTTWAEESAAGRIAASGERSDLSGCF